MNLTHAATFESPKKTTNGVWENVWSIPVDPTLSLFVEVSGMAMSGVDSYCWGQTGLWNSALGVLTPVLAGDGLRNVFADIKTAGASWNVRVQIIDSHLNVDINGAPATTVYWVVRLEFIQWPDMGQFPASVKP
jgi:hypothetical protein